MSGREHWEGVYREKAVDEVSWFQAAPTRSLDWIEAAAPDRASSLIDVGAGASLLVDRLLDRGYGNVAVLDLAESALERVKERLGERASGVEWFAGNVLDFFPPHPFDLWHDRAVLHFLVDPEQRRRYAEVLRRTLRPGGHALIATFAHGGPTRCSGLDVVQYDCAEIAALLGDDFVRERDEQEIHHTPGGADQLFQYCLLSRRAGDV